MPVKAIVADTGPVLHLHQIGALHLLNLLGEVQLVPAVVSELQRHAPTIGSDTLPDSAHLIQPSPEATAKARSWVVSGLLHAGEAEALAHAREVAADLFLTDDAAARVMAESLGVQARGSLGVILYCAANGAIQRSEAEQHLFNLGTRSTLWLSSVVRQKADSALAAIYLR